MKLQRTAYTFLLFLLAWRVAPAQSGGIEEALTPEQVSQLLKEEWIFLHTQVDEFIKKTEKRDEFETQPEYEIRVARERKAFLDQVNGHVHEKNLDKRSFTTLLKANFIRYHIDSSYYSISAPMPIEAPYDIPQLVTTVPSNPHVGLADTTERGFRKSNLYLKYQPEFRWSVNRDIARNARDDSSNIAFRLKFTLDLTQNPSGKQAVLRILPKEVALYNAMRKTIYWKEDIK
jgi:hypothetical protein